MVFFNRLLDQVWSLCIFGGREVLLVPGEVFRIPRFHLVDLNIGHIATADFEGKHLTCPDHDLGLHGEGGERQLKRKFPWLVLQPKLWISPAGLLEFIQSQPQPIFTQLGKPYSNGLFEVCRFPAVCHMSNIAIVYSYSIPTC